MTQSLFQGNEMKFHTIILTAWSGLDPGGVGGGPHTPFSSTKKVKRRARTCGECTASSPCPLVQILSPLSKILDPPLMVTLKLR